MGGKMRFLAKAVALSAVLSLAVPVIGAINAQQTDGAAVVQSSAKKILVVFYTRTGNTERVGKDIARSLSADIERIVEVERIADKKDRKGLMNSLRAGREAMKERLTDIEPIVNDPAKYDMVLIGTPIWAWNMTPAVRRYISDNKASFKEVAFFTTSGSTKPDKIVAKMEVLSGLKARGSVGFFERDFEVESKVIYDKKLSDFLAGLK